MNLRVTRVVDETWDTKTFYLEDAEEGGRPYDFHAGQYLTFRFDDIAEKPLVRSYTMSGSPLQTSATIFTVKRVEGGIVSNWLCDRVGVGSLLRARGPIGRFCFDPQLDSGRDFYMIAGGSGVTPFVSILREYAHRVGQPDCPLSLHLLVAYRSTQDLICIESLREAAEHSGVRLVLSLTREKASIPGRIEFKYGRPSEEMLREFLNPVNEHSIVMTCGPQQMMDLSCAQALKLGLSESQIRTESFFS